MSDRRPPLDAEAVDLLLQVLELREPILSGAAAELSPRSAAVLAAAGLLVPHGHEDVSASQADHEDTPVSLIWSEGHGGFTYFSPAVGLAPVPQERLVRYRVDAAVMLDAMAEGLDRPSNRVAFPLVNGVLWEIGEVRLGRRPVRVPLWFARRLTDPVVLRQVTDAARARPHNRLRVILTSARPSRAAEVEIRGATVVALRDVLATPDTLAVSPDILDARLAGVPVRSDAGPIALSPDHRQLRINGGPPISFKSDAQMAAIRKLVDAHRQGERLRISELTDHGSLARLFGAKKWALLRPHISSIDGLWGFDL